MPFEMTLKYTTPLTAVPTLDEALREFLKLVGYLREGEQDSESIAYRLVRDCFMGNPGRTWTIDELVAVLKTTKPTLYRHLNRLKALDIVEDVSLNEKEAKARKGYRLRYGNIARAWDFAEANAENAMKRYREGVDHIQKLLESAPQPASKSK